MAHKKKKKSEKREEALKYLSEIILANRTIKDWMIRNTYYAVLAQIGIYATFKDTKDLFGWLVALILSILVWFLTFVVLRSNQRSIETLRKQERRLVERTPLPWIRKNWAIGNSGEGQEDRYPRIYRPLVIGTGLVIMVAMTRGNSPVQELFCKIVCPTNSSVTNIAK